jgi:hypothetical protein
MNDEYRAYLPLPLSKIPPSLWRGRERVFGELSRAAGVRVDI